MGYLHPPKIAQNARLRIFSFALSTLIIAIILAFMGFETENSIASQPKSPIIYSHFDIEYTAPKPIPKEELAKKEILPQLPLKQPKQNLTLPKPESQSFENFQLKIRNNKSGLTNTNTANIPNQNQAASPNIASSGGNTQLPKLAAQTQNTIFLAECEKADPLERPPNCPTNSKVKKMVDIANGPRYRPERVRGFSASEVNAKYFAGWRDKCQTNEGNQAQVCISIGKKPPRVKTPQELCLEQGLSHCNGVPMPKRENPTNNE